MSNINAASQHCNCNLSIHSFNGRSNTNRTNKVSYFCRHSKPGLNFLHQSGRTWPQKCTIPRAMSDAIGPDNPEEDESVDPKESESASKRGDYSQESIRDNLEKMVGKDDSSFSGIDLATLIRKKYGKSYDVQLIKKEFMGRNLLAMNVMWKYMEQRSFPLTEEEYILRLDNVANSLKCWGAVSHIRNSLENSKERPRIGKAVSIFIDMDESGGRDREWIYK